MIDAAYARTMAAYNRWQNASLYTAADALSEAERRAPRGAFWGSIHGTLAHLAWGDSVWLARFSATAPPSVPIKRSSDFVDEWATLKAERARLDTRIENWAATLDATWLAGDMSWFSAAMNRQVTKPTWILVAHMFNHQTHHRGQVHAMLTAAGTKPDDTDLPFMPGLD